MNTQRGRWFAQAALIALGLVATACTSSSGEVTLQRESSDDTALDVGSETTSTVAVIDPVDTAAPATDPAATDPPATDSAATDSAGTEPPATEPSAHESPTAGPGQACVASREGVSCLQDDGTWVVYDETSGLASNFVTALDVCDTGEIVVSNSASLQLHDGTRWLELTEPFEFGGVDHIQCTSADEMWVGGFDEAAHWTSGSWELFEPSILGDGIIDDLELDPDGHPWFGSSAGIYTYDGATWTSYTESDTFENHSVDDLSFAPNGRLEAVLLLSRATFDGDAWVESDDSGTATAVAATDDAVLVGTFNRGVDLIVGGTTATLDRASGDLPTDKIESMTVDASGRVWVGTQYGLVVVEDGVVQQTFQMHTSGIHDNLIRNISVQGAGPTVLDAPISTPVSTFSGVITDGTAPVEGARVEICVLPLLDSFDGATPCSDQPINYTATTGSDGAFEMTGVVRGRYVFVVDPGAGWIQATGEFGISSERVLIDRDLDIGDFAAVAADD